MEILATLLLWLSVTQAEPGVSLEDLRLFPPPAQVKVIHAAAWDYWYHRDSTPTFLSQQECSAWYAHFEAAYRVYDVWDDLRIAQNGDVYPDDWRLDSLRRLRRAIGDEAYYHGAMPALMYPWK